jgi:hypothetical protein
LRAKIRRKDGKEHRSWSLVENKRVKGAATRVDDAETPANIGFGAGYPALGNALGNSRFWH